MTGEEPDPVRLLGFVRSFTSDDRPSVVMLTGGEPLLLPELAAELAATARAAGSRTALLSGMFFARGGRTPARILRAITALDHFSASLDAHHEREVPREDVFREVRRVLDAGVPVSFHLTGTGDDDPYLAELTADIRRVFADQVPMLVSRIRPLGRAAAWAAATEARPDRERALPCAMAAWPVVAADGTVLACCNQETVDRRPAPAHLLLGHLGSDDWPTVHRRSLESPALRMLRAVGPAHLYARFGDPAACTGYCEGCRALGDHPAVLAGVRRTGSGPVGELLDLQAARSQLAAGPAALVRRFGSARYADLAELAPAPPAERADRADRADQAERGPR
jgi:hypothetical protein